MNYKAFKTELSLRQCGAFNYARYLRYATPSKFISDGVFSSIFGLVDTHVVVDDLIIPDVHSLPHGDVVIIVVFNSLVQLNELRPVARCVYLSKLKVNLPIVLPFEEALRWYDLLWELKSAFKQPDVVF